MLYLAVHALSRGCEVDTWVCNTRHMDPTWFQQPTDVLAKLKARAGTYGTRTELGLNRTD